MLNIRIIEIIRAVDTEDVTRYEVGDLGINVAIEFLYLMSVVCIPFPDESSSHPWSVDFIN
jgi:hypothetical protein